MGFTSLSLAQVAAALRDNARDAESIFGHLDGRQLNWKPEPGRWSVAQCFQHLLTADHLMMRSAQDARRDLSRTFWQRLPVLPSVWGVLLVRSQSPGTRRKFIAPIKARPSASEIPDDIVRRFVDHQTMAAAWTESIPERDAVAVIMASPFLKYVTYSVLDGCRLMAAHDRRHCKQAQRLLTAPGYPSASKEA
jgi:hypothetical protein